MKNILQETAIESTHHIKHVLATLLQSLTRYLKVLNYHGNINPQTITAETCLNKSKQKDNLKKKKVIKK